MRLKRGEPEQIDRLRELSEAFRPAAPIERKALFSGRTAQLGDLFAVADQPGQHALVYGERGVGKTSLVVVAGQTLAAADVRIARATCDRSDDFESVWTKALDEMQYTMSRPGIGFGGQTREARVGGGKLLRADAAPHDVLRALEALTGQGRAMVFIDEFDRLAVSEARLLFADTIKTLSDRLPNVTVVLVGVADDAAELIEEHRSIERALRTIHMPRMSHGELSQIVERGIAEARLTIEPDAVAEIATLADGFPHYAHLLGQESGRVALEDLRAHVTPDDVRTAASDAFGSAASL
ncbi:MAG TPA: ATP-binding protein [Gaiellaceae bacterium]|nr:ATP-binding protein [Gaiellaceae bacterium]